MSSEDRDHEHGKDSIENEVEKIEGITIVPQPTQRQLNSEQLDEFKTLKTDFINWALEMGSLNGGGYQATTLKPYASRIDKFFRWLWKKNGEFTTDINREDAHSYFRYLERSDDYSDHHKSGSYKALKTLYRWLEFMGRAKSLEKENPFDFDRKKNSTDYLSLKERWQLAQASIKYGLLTPSFLDGKDDPEVYVSQTFHVKKEELEIDDIRSWKIPSMVFVSLDTGFRPMDINRASVDWIDLNNNTIKTPGKHAVKNDVKHNTSLGEVTVRLLKQWLDEREEKEMYDDTDKIWLTSEGNPYGSQALRRLMKKLLKIAGIDTRGRDWHWTIIRHSTGTYFRHYGSKGEASSQLRHVSEDSIETYDHCPPDVRKDTIETINREARRAFRESRGTAD